MLKYNAIHPNKHSPYSKPTLIIPVHIQSFSIPFSNYQQLTCLITAEHLKTIPSTTNHKVKLQAKATSKFNLKQLNGNILQISIQSVIEIQCNFNRIRMVTATSSICKMKMLQMLHKAHPRAHECDM